MEQRNNIPTSERSAALYRQALNIMPGGCSRNTVLRQPHPLYADHGQGCYVTDIEGVQRIDFANNMAALIHGHAQPQIVAAVTAQLQKGTAFTLLPKQKFSMPNIYAAVIQASNRSAL